MTRWSRLYGPLYGKLAVTASQVGDEIYVPLRSGLINPLTDAFDITIPLAHHLFAHHLNNQHGDPHGR